MAKFEVYIAVDNSEELNSDISAAINQVHELFTNGYHTCTTTHAGIDGRTVKIDYRLTTGPKPRKRRKKEQQPTQA